MGENESRDGGDEGEKKVEERNRNERASAWVMSYF